MNDVVELTYLFRRQTEVLHTKNSKFRFGTFLRLKMFHSLVSCSLKMAGTCIPRSFVQLCARGSFLDCFFTEQLYFFRYSTN